MENTTLSEFLNECFTYQIDSKEPTLGVIERSISVGFNFKDTLQNNSELEEELMKMENLMIKLVISYSLYSLFKIPAK